jgi:regulator of replication initiation timing
MDDISLNHEQYVKLLDKLESINFELLKVKRANSKLKSDNRHLRRVIKNLKDAAAKERKPHYRNGRRGSKFNG